MKRLLLFALTLLATTLVHAQTTLVSWTFPAGNASDSLPTTSLAINSAFGFRAVGTSAINYSTNGVTTFCAQATNWDNGMNSKYWSVRFLSTGYENLHISCAVRSGGSNPGPRDFKVQYRIYPQVNWTDVTGTTLVAANNWTSGVLSNVSLPADLNNLSNIVELRWVMTSNLNASGGTVAATGISKIDNVVVTGTQLVGSIGGYVQYSNPNNTALQNVRVKLYNGNVLTDSTITDSFGHYFFTGLAAGNYNIRCSSTNTWGGANSLDALLALKQFVGLVNLAGLYFKAADVNGNGYINSMDGLDISKRFVGTTASFTGPDWLFELSNVDVIPGIPVTQDIKGICAGDINGSFTP